MKACSSRSRQQTGAITIELVAVLPMFIVMLVLIADVSLYIRHRQQVQSAAFSLASILANRSDYFEDTLKGNPIKASKITKTSLQDELQLLEKMAELQLSIGSGESVGINAAVIYFQGGKEQRLTASSPSSCANPANDWQSLAMAKNDKAAYYAVWLCHSKPWHWQSEGFIGLALRKIHGREIIGRALAAER